MSESEPAAWAPPQFYVHQAQDGVVTVVDRYGIPLACPPPVARIINGGEKYVDPWGNEVPTFTFPEKYFVHTAADGSMTAVDASGVPLPTQPQLNHGFDEGTVVTPGPDGQPFVLAAYEFPEKYFVHTAADGSMTAVDASGVPLPTQPQLNHGFDEGTVVTPGPDGQPLVLAAYEIPEEGFFVHTAADGTRSAVDESGVPLPIQPDLGYYDGTTLAPGPWDNYPAFEFSKDFSVYTAPDGTRTAVDESGVPLPSQPDLGYYDGTTLAPGPWDNYPAYQLPQTYYVHTAPDGTMIAVDENGKPLATQPELIREPEDGTISVKGPGGSVYHPPPLYPPSGEPPEQWPPPGYGESELPPGGDSQEGEEEEGIESVEDGTTVRVSAEAESGEGVEAEDRGGRVAEAIVGEVESVPRDLGGVDGEAVVETPDLSARHEPIEAPDIDGKVTPVPEPDAVEFKVETAPFDVETARITVESVAAVESESEERSTEVESDIARVDTSEQVTPSPITLPAMPEDLTPVDPISEVGAVGLGAEDLVEMVTGADRPPTEAERAGTDSGGPAERVAEIPDLPLSVEPIEMAEIESKIASPEPEPVELLVESAVGKSPAKPAVESRVSEEAEPEAVRAVPIDDGSPVGLGVEELVEMATGREEATGEQTSAPAMSQPEEPILEIPELPVVEVAEVIGLPEMEGKITPAPEAESVEFKFFRPQDETDASEFRVEVSEAGTLEIDEEVAEGLTRYVEEPEEEPTWVSEEDPDEEEEQMQT